MVSVGDTIAAEQSLITVESDKASMEVPSSNAGVVTANKVKLGDKVNKGSIILELQADGGAKPAPAAAAQAPTPAASANASAQQAPAAASKPTQTQALASVPPDRHSPPDALAAVDLPTRPLTPPSPPVPPSTCELQRPL